MVNNIGKTTQSLSTSLGVETPFITTENITILTGEIAKGFLLFDSVGTLGVISSFIDETNFIVRTYALSLDITSILSMSY